MFYLNSDLVIYLTNIKMYLEKKILAVLIIFISFSCNDTVKLKEEDVVKYDWLRPFVININDEFYGTHDIENNILKFNYNVNNPENIISKFDKIAISEKWQINKINNATRAYSKEILIYGYTMKKITIQINYSKDENKIFFNVN